MKNSQEKHESIRPSWQHALRSFWSGSLSLDVSLADYCTLRTGGPAAALLVVTSREELAKLVVWLEENGVKWRILGRGSNVLFSDQGFAGAVIVLGGEFCAIREEPAEAGQQGTMVRAGAGCAAARLVGWATGRGLAGLEFMVGIPGSIGGAVRMNAGAWGGEIGELVREVNLLDRNGEFRRLPHTELEFSYRRMRPLDPGLEEAVIIDALFELQSARQREIIARCRELVARRRERQPATMASAGSFFRNPPGDSAGRLIDAAGLKGLRCGGAMVSSRHANFIVNTGGATAGDILDLMRKVQEKVFDFSGIRLEPEIHLL